MFEGGMRKHKPMESNFELQITALIDTLVIILIFLLKSVATDTLEIEQAKNLSMPSVMDGMTAGKGNKLAIATDGVSWNGAKIINYANFSSIGERDQTWKNLESVIASSEQDDKSKKMFDGKLLLQADKETPFPILSAALKIAKSHGYKDIRFIGAKFN